MGVMDRRWGRGGVDYIPVGGEINLASQFAK
jgi:hypothetical protein